MSVDGFVAGSNMSEQKPFDDLPESFLSLGIPGALEGLLHRWVFDEPEKHKAEIDELWLHIVPATIGKGQRLFDNVPSLHMEPISCRGTELVTHIKYSLINK